MTLLHEIFKRTGRTPDEILSKSETVRLFCYQSVIKQIEEDGEDRKLNVNALAQLFGGKKK